MTRTNHIVQKINKIIVISQSLFEVITKVWSVLLKMIKTEFSSLLFFQSIYNLHSQQSMKRSENKAICSYRTLRTSHYEIVIVKTAWDQMESIIYDWRYQSRPWVKQPFSVWLVPLCVNQKFLCCSHDA